MPPDPTDGSDPEALRPYEVLARKYRPSAFNTLIGQEAMVRTLRNAFESNRIPHAFILTGIRGVGKTTTARIIAKGLNCSGPEGASGPTIQPCGTCDSCISVGESRHIDVVEIDAASHTGVDNVRELIDGARQRPNWGRYRVYIIDEVHMLSTSAFNALLKTLEEPPPHVKFVLATTEIRKVPVTILSRCQRFDLRRINAPMLSAHLAGLARNEGAKIEPPALDLITRAAEGSVRDGVSLLDQAIAYCGREISADDVRDMLGLADRGRVIDLFEHIARGRVSQALTEFGSQFEAGADPLAVMDSLAESCHWVSMLRVAPDLANDPTVSPDAAVRGQSLAGSLTAPVLVRFWQVLESALRELKDSGNPRLSAEMAIIRLAHASTLPTPGELVAELAGGLTPARAPDQSRTEPRPHSEDSPLPQRSAAHQTTMGERERPPEHGTEQDLTSADVPAATSTLTVEGLLALARRHGNSILALQIERHFRPVEFGPGSITFQPGSGARPKLAKEILTFLAKTTGERWAVQTVDSKGGATLAEETEEAKREARDAALRNPDVDALQTLFPDATLEIEVLGEDSRDRSA